MQLEAEAETMNQLTLDFDATRKTEPMGASPGFPLVSSDKPAEQRDACQQTSRDAYLTTDRKNDRSRIAAFVRGRGAIGATRDEISVELSIGLPTVCGRVRELFESELVYASGRRRPTRTGSMAVVMVWRS